MRTFKQNFFRIFISVILVAGVAIAGCDAPAGPEGAEGPQGPEGPIGPAGEDGSVMYAGEGEPDTDIGDSGDYYLNQNTGELYGPKDSDGWGDPGVVLMGEDGADGEDGQDGTDGQDGSQIYSGEGEPDDELGSEGDYYLNEDEHELYGPKTGNGWGNPLDLKGADGNANVTRYIFSGHDFSSEEETERQIPVESEEVMKESAWIIYLIDNPFHYPMPGYGRAGQSQYRTYYVYFDNMFDVSLLLEEGTGEEYDSIEVIRVESSDTEDLRTKIGQKLILEPIEYDKLIDILGVQ